MLQLRYKLICLMDSKVLQGSTAQLRHGLLLSSADRLICWLAIRHSGTGALSGGRSGLDKNPSVFLLEVSKPDAS